MPDQVQILAQFDAAGLVGVQIIIAIFTALFVVLSLVCAITLTAFIAYLWLMRKAFVLILSYKPKFKLATGMSI